MIRWAERSGRALQGFASCTQESETSKKRIARLESALQATGADETVLRKISDACFKKRMKGISCDVFGPTFHECLFLLFFNPASTKEYCPVRVSDILLFLSGMLSTGSFIVCQTSFARRPAQKLSRGAGNLKNGGFVGPETFNFQPPFWRLPQSLFKFWKTKLKFRTEADTCFRGKRNGMKPDPPVLGPGSRDHLQNLCRHGKYIRYLDPICRACRDTLCKKAGTSVTSSLTWRICYYGKYHGVCVAESDCEMTSFSESD